MGANKYSISLIIVISLLLYSTIVQATPSISSTSGSWVHDGSVTITSGGNDFGSKSPAAPIVWDATDDESASSISTYYPGQVGPADCVSYGGTPSETPYQIDYYTSFHGYDGTPHNRITKFIASAHIKCTGGSPGDWDSHWSDNFVTVLGWDTLFLYAMYYYRLSSEFSDTTEPYNLKEVAANCDDCTYLGKIVGGSDAYLGPCTEPVDTYPDDLFYRGDDNSCDTDDRFYAPNPMGGWVHQEWAWDDNGYGFWWSDGSDSGGQWSVNLLRPIDNCGETPCGISIGGFNRFPRDSETGNYRFWAGLYIDDTWSRVMIGNASDWDSCTIREPQIPSAWATDEITVTVNLGAFTGSSAYLYVFDSTNAVNATGYAITLDVGDDAEAAGINPTGVNIQ